MRRFRVDVRRGERWWILSIPAIPAAHSQARSLREVEATARDLIALMLEIPPTSFDVDIDIDLPVAASEHLARAQDLRQQAALAQSAAAAESRAAARALAATGMPLRDIGTALGVSHQRAHQLVNS